MDDTKDTIGNFFYENGYTPTVVVIKDGKNVDGFIGYQSEENIKEMLQKYL